MTVDLMQPPAEVTGPASRPDTTEPLLAVSGLGKAFDMHHLGRRLPAFEEVAFDLHAGQFLLVKGGNGAGKSTLLRTLYRTYRAGTGQAIYRSQHGPIDLLRAADIDMAYMRRTEIGFVTQFLQARPRVSAEDFVAEALMETGEPRAAARDRAREALDAFGLKQDLWAAYPTAFSGGEQQKVNLARALIRPHKLLLLDEPTASLDAPARTALITRLALLKKAGTAIIAVFHTHKEVEPIVDGTLALYPPNRTAAVGRRQQ